MGKAIRAGQERGEIRTRGEHSLVLPDRKNSTQDYYGGGSEQADIATMATADTETFDVALTEARAEGNVSRANVVRKVKASADAKPRSAPRRALR